MKEGKITPTYHQPFDVLTVMATAAKEGKAADPTYQPEVKHCGG